LANINGIMHVLDSYQKEGLLKKEPPLASTNALLAPLMVNEMYRRVIGDLQTPTIDLQEYVDAFLHGREP
jgi:hypothetical protein